MYESPRFCCLLSNIHLPSAHNERITYFTKRIFLVYSTYNCKLPKSDRPRDLPIDFSGAMLFTKAEH